MGNDFEVCLLVEFVETSVVDLIHFAEGEEFAEFGYCANHADVVGACCERERVGDKEIADEDGYVVVPNGVDGGVSVATVGVVDDVVVYERCVVEDFDGGCRSQSCFVDLTAKEFGCEHNEHGSQLFAFVAHVAVDDLIHHWI